MKLEDQVCNLELAQKLKELGVKQESYYFWAERVSGTGHPSDPSIHTVEFNLMTGHPYGVFPERYSAFTVAELGEMLPVDTTMEISFNHNTKTRKYIVSLPTDVGWEGSPTYDNFEADTEANARAEMLVYLIENKLIQLAPKQEEGK